MTSGAQDRSQKHLALCREALDKARADGDDVRVSVALADLGFALFQVREFEQGLAQFEQAVERAERLGDVGLQARCWGIKTLAFQSIGRLPDAFQAAAEVLRLGKEHGAPGLACDALTSQGQILLESGEPTLAFAKLQGARETAHEIDDQRRLMNVLGTLGNYALAVAATDQAEAYFDKAQRLAGELGDRQAEYGFLGNKAAVLAWQGSHRAAISAFERVLPYVQEIGNRAAEIQALRHLAQLQAKLGADEKAVDYALRGIGLAQESDAQATLAFWEIVIPAYYRMNEIVAAQDATVKAINLAQSMNNESKEVDLLLSLAESFYLSEAYKQALPTYEKALEGAKKLERRKDQAYLTGRVGVVLAELGRLDDAIIYHRQALALARERDIPDLEGEQLLMLVMAHLEKGERARAKGLCNEAINVYAAAELEQEANRARQLLGTIES